MDQAHSSIYRREALLAQAQVADERVPLPLIPRWTTWLAIALVLVPAVAVSAGAAIRIDRRVVGSAERTQNGEGGSCLEVVLPAGVARGLAPGLRCDIVGSDGSRVGAAIDAVESPVDDDAVTVRVRPDQPLERSGRPLRVAIIAGDETLLQAVLGAATPVRQER